MSQRDKDLPLCSGADEGHAIKCLFIKQRGEGLNALEFFNCLFEVLSQHQMIFSIAFAGRVSQLQQGLKLKTKEVCKQTWWRPQRIRPEGFSKSAQSDGL